LVGALERQGAKAEFHRRPDGRRQRNTRPLHPTDALTRAPGESSLANAATGAARRTAARLAISRLERAAQVCGPPFVCWRRCDALLSCAGPQPVPNARSTLARVNGRAQHACTLARADSGTAHEPLRRGGRPLHLHQRCIGHGRSLGARSDSARTSAAAGCRGGAVIESVLLCALRR
jgi:hypothetical protein